jgi:hypothetical protein
MNKNYVPQVFLYYSQTVLTFWMHFVWNLQKTNYVISKLWMVQKIVIVLTDWSEEDKQGEVEEEGSGHWVIVLRWWAKVGE